MDFLHQLWLAPAPAITPPYLDVDHGPVEMKNHSPACLPHPLSIPHNSDLGWPGIPVTKCSMDCTKTYLTAQTRPCCLNLRQVELNPS